MQKHFQSEASACRQKAAYSTVQEVLVNARKTIENKIGQHQEEHPNDIRSSDQSDSV